MNEIEKKSILNFVTREIDASVFYKEHPYYSEDDYLLEQYEKALKNKDKELLDYISMLPFSKKIKFNDVFRRLIVENWHIQNEDIASAFQHTFNYDIANIPTLLRAIKLTPNYGEMKYSYIRKIIYAIGAQPEPYNINALIKLSEDVDDNEIKELALHQIKKRKKLGRWETKQNT